MNYEKIRLKVAHLLLGERHTARFAVMFPYLLKILQLLLWGLGVANVAVFENGTQGRVLAVLFAVSLLLLYFTAVSFDLLRDRWLYSKLSGGKRFYKLFLNFSFADFLLAVKLSAVTRLRCALRAVLFLSFPLTVCFYCFYLSDFTMSRIKWAVCFGGCFVLLLVGVLFAFASFCPLLLAKKLCCYKKTDSIRCFFSDASLFDLKSIKLFGFLLTYYPFFGAKKQLAAMLFSQIIFPKAQFKASEMSSVNKL